MSTIADPETLTRLLARLEQLTPTSERRWGTMTAAEMLCHLGDAGDSVLGRRVTPGTPPSGKKKSLLKWIALSSPFAWPKGVKTRPGVDPKQDGTRPEDFAADRARVVSGLRALAQANEAELAPFHVMFGPMSRRDWQRWAFRHVDHHLRQFGL
jgi:DinB superfamily